MPEKAADFDTIRHVLRIVTEELAIEKQEVGQHQSTPDDVQTMKAGQHEVDRVVGIEFRREIGQQLDVLAIQCDRWMMTAMAL